MREKKNDGVRVRQGEISYPILYIIVGLDYIFVKIHKPIGHRFLVNKITQQFVIPYYEITIQKILLSEHSEPLFSYDFSDNESFRTYKTSQPMSLGHYFQTPYFA